MTTIEHALLGANGALAAGLHRRYGWQVAVMAGFAAVCPDWDGLTLLGGPVLFDRAHRVWGHNFLACGLLGVLVGIVDYRYDLMTRISRRVFQVLRRLTGEDLGSESLTLRNTWTGEGYLVWVGVAIIATTSHLAADLVVSGHRTLGDWKLPLLWPFSDESWIYPHVRWGDPGITILFMLGMLAMYRWRSRIQLVAAATLLAVAAYILIRGAMLG